MTCRWGWPRISCWWRWRCASGCRGWPRCSPPEMISYRLVNAIVYRTGLIRDPAAMAKVEEEVASAAAGWGSLSMTKVESAIDYWVDRYDPDAVRRAETSARGRYVEVKPPDGGTGLSRVEALLFGHDAEALDHRLEAMARAVCDGDPRTMTQRRSDALGAWGHGGDRLACGCGDPHCEAAAAAPSAVVVNVIAEENSLADDTAAQLDGADPAGPTTEQLRNMTIAAGAGPAARHGTGQHQSGGDHGWRNGAGAVVGGQAGHHRQDPAGDSSRRQRARTALYPVGGVGPVCPLPGPDVPVPGLR